MATMPVYERWNPKPITRADWRAECDKLRAAHKKIALENVALRLVLNRVAVLEQQGFTYVTDTPRQWAASVIAQYEAALNPTVDATAKVVHLLRESEPYEG
jgi:hypothetical protein